MKHIFSFVAVFLLAMQTWAQTQPQPASGPWQQKVKYTMDIRMDVQTNRFTGKQRLEYTNQSPDTLTRLFYHLYWNAFQPNSMMDVRSRELGKKIVNNRPDWDARVKDRIEQLKPDEIGYQKVLSLKMNGVAQQYKMHETILEVVLSKPILPRTKAVLEMDFEAQVPVQIRRSGRDNAEGIRYSMSQWYPKICAYDEAGWHPNPYIAREFYAPWGDFTVNITIDSSYVLGGTGYLQNAQQIGHGYELPGTKVTRPAGNMLTWRFEAPNVHDFMWAADPQYKHISKNVNGVTLHVLYEPRNQREDSAWRDVLYATEKALPYIEQRFGKYPYKQYSFIQGGDGGMEYAMSTLLKGPGLGTVFHEWMHTWYQFLMATNESLYPWMDEGFTSWAEGEVSAWYYANHAGASPYTNERQKAQQQNNNNRAIEQQPARHADAYAGYFALVKSGKEEPMTTHADRH
ncbi:MAG: M1 family metallopeptidase, partial [Chitinophagaceae bacterium]